MKQERILVVEDEPRIARLVCDNLEAEGYRISLATDGESALRAIRAGGQQLILLDVMLPNLDGFSICRQIRQEGDRTPVIFVTAKDLTPDRVKGLLAGGDDYLVKPFHLDELLARVHAVLRRAHWNQTAVGEPIAIGDGWINLETRESCRADGSHCTLNAKEFGILKLLVEARGGIITRQKILDNVWGEESEPTPRTVDNYMVQLRKHFENDPARPSSLLTIRGTGYRLKI
ncbi:MAG: response regulator transcription factor [Planctomycetota bacterium]|nr:response regulator transcription factor [Planctomycetota bacterium]